MRNATVVSETGAYSKSYYRVPLENSNSVTCQFARIRGLLPKPEFVAPLLAMAERTDVKIHDRRGDSQVADVCKELEGVVETGEGRTPRPEDSTTRTSTSLAGT